MAPLTPAAVDSFILSDLQPLNVSPRSYTPTRTCVNVGCLTNANFLGDMNVCPGTPASFSNESLLGVSYVWKVNGATVSTSTNLNYTFPIGGTYTLRLVATGANGCKDSLSQTLTVPALVVPVATSNSPVVTLGTINLSVSATPGATYSWTGPNSFSSSTQNPNIPSAMPIMTGGYFVTVTSGYCTALDSVFVTVSSNVSTAGTILSPLADSVRTVNLNLSGPTTSNIVTGNNGTYSFLNLQPNGNYTVTPSKNNDVNKTNGVSTLDIVLIRRHILVADTLNTPYKILAADVNNSGTVSTLDLVFIRSLILGTDTTFPGNRLWSFVPSTTTFPDPVNPWNPSAPPNSLSYINMGGAQTGQNFIGMKLGDVNNSWSPLIAKAKSVGELHLNFSDVTAKPGELISIPVSVGKFNQIAGLQATINWDKSILQFVEAEDAKLNCHFGKHKVNEGMLSFSWNEESGKTLSLEDGSPAMILTFEVIGKMGEMAELKISDAITEAEAYNSNLDLLDIQSVSGKIKIAEKIEELNSDELFNVFPNPNSGIFTLNFSESGNQIYSILIYNQLGQEILNEIISTTNGTNSKKIDISRFGKGIYTVVVGNGAKQLAKKVRVD